MKKRSDQAGPTSGRETPLQAAIKKAEIAPTTAKRWQAEASIPEPIFETFVATAKAAVTLPEPAVPEHCKGVYSTHTLGGPQRLPHGSFTSMVEAELPFGEATARRLMIIADDKRLSNRAQGHALPPSWRTLYELTKLDDETWGSLSPKVMRHAGAQSDLGPLVFLPS